MATSVLSQASALNPGSDLWIVPDLEQSPWTAKLDWYLNFQICKASRHHTLPLSSYVSEVLAETELERPALGDKASAPLMIASQSLLPNKWVVILPWNGDMNDWSQKIIGIWQNLKQPSLRIFLPPGQNAGSLDRSWQSQQVAELLTVVLD